MSRATGVSIGGGAINQGGDGIRYISDYLFFLYLLSHFLSHLPSA